MDTGLKLQRGYHYAEQIAHYHANLTGCDLQADIQALSYRLTALHIHDNNGLKDQHLIPYTQKDPATRDNYTDWDGMLSGLREISYCGPISFETHPALAHTPAALVPEMLKFIAAVGNHFRSALQE